MKRTSIKRKPRKGSKSELKREAQKVFNAWIRERDNHICVTCDKPGGDAGHFINVSQSERLRYDERNVHCQCSYCNRDLHGNKVAYSKYLRKRYGNHIINELTTARHTIKTWSMDELREVIERYG
jgi:hypothetical protein